ncbi:MAG: TAT-variant-translocated molybdopterin oxidoreductase [Verrucomicrobiaceae bacterium]|nr:TAT-variant-translocated molybdopterin oxidoreductase [Verrucomicrobiaceae bacterium]
MKRIWNHPEEPKTGRRYWRSINELESREDFMKSLGTEFPNGDMLNDEERENSRRNFLKIMGASAGLMGLASCRRPIARLVPFTSSVEWAVPGKPLFYATSMPRAGGATPLVVTTHDGRPTHLTGNPVHPSVSGGVDAFAQASILDMYDPDRSREPLHSGRPATWGGMVQALTKVRHHYAENGGDGLALLVGGEVSPTLARIRADLAKRFPKAKFYRYEAASGSQTKVNEALLGAGVTPVVRLNKAARVFCLDADFLGLDPVSDDSVAEFTSTRNAEKPSEAEKMSRLYVLENRYTLTGAMADHRKAVSASALAAAAAALAAKLGVGEAPAALAGSVDPALKAWVETAAEDLLAHKGKAVVLAGSRTSEAIQALAAACNNALGAFGTVIETYKNTDDTLSYGSLKDLHAAMAAGQVKVLFSFTQSDPIFDAPTSWNLDKLASEKGVKVFHHGIRKCASARAASWHIPGSHFLESWGDVRTKDGTYGIVQPMIQPLYDGVSELDVCLSLLGKRELDRPDPKPIDPKAPPPPPPVDAAYEAVRETFAKIAGGLDEQKWNFTLRDGFLKDSTAKPASATFNAGGVAALLTNAKPAGALSATAPEVVLVPDSSLWDGRFANNGWLQEAPDPVTKLTWDNAALIGSKTFRELGLSEGTWVKITTPAGSLEIPAIEAPGHVSNSITIQLGYGQRKIGNVGSKVGFNGYGLRASTDEWVISSGVKVEKLGRKAHEFAITQEHNSMEGRAVYREGTHKDKENFAQVTGIDSHIPPEMTFYKGQFGVKSATNEAGFDYETKHQWGMTIDLSKCIGCTACLIACQSENNIPIVGKDQVRKGRVMHWIRMDRYFATAEVGTEKDHHTNKLPSVDDVHIEPTAEQLEDAQMVNQPVACQQCESAPCETVCPVNATVHTDDGLNAMAYNRCIGTRYCANNCPYTARRFNWFDYNKRPLDELYMGPLSTPDKTGMRESLKLQKNPNVTVRMRGVIEKCTYCVQRLEAAKINQKQTQRDSKNFRVATDSVKTACQQSCPAGAIEFGDLANKDSTVNKLKLSPRNYTVLKYLNTRPRTTYLARIRNINDKMPGAANIAAWSSKQF